MRAASAKAQGYEKVSAAARIDSFSARIMDPAVPFAVVDADGNVIGEITSAAVTDLLVGKERRAP